MNVEIGAEAALFPEKKYVNGIAVAMHPPPQASGQIFKDDVSSFSSISYIYLKFLTYQVRNC
jgi:hypothetical protein